MLSRRTTAFFLSQLLCGLFHFNFGFCPTSFLPLFSCPVISFEPALLNPRKRHKRFFAFMGWGGGGVHTLMSPLATPQPMHTDEEPLKCTSAILYLSGLRDVDQTVLFYSYTCSFQMPGFWLVIYPGTYSKRRSRLIFL